MTVNPTPDLTWSGNDVFQGTTVNMPIPGGISAGMLLVVSVFFAIGPASSITGFTSSTPWTEITTGSANDKSFWYKIADAGDATDSAAGGRSWTINCSNGFVELWCGAAWSGVDNTTPFATGPGTNFSNSTTFTFTSQTAPDSSAVWVGLFVSGQNSGAVTDPTSPVVNQASGTSPFTDAESRVYSATGITGAFSPTGSVAVGFEWATVAFFLNPAASGGSQVPPRWPWNFDYDDAAVWSGSPTRSALLANLLTAGGQIKPRWPWNFAEDHATVWSGSPTRSALLANLLTAGGKVKPRWPWNFAEDHATVWNGQPTDSALLANLLTAGGKVKPRWPWNFGLDDPAVWSGSPIDSALLANLLTAGGKVKPRWIWNFNYDDPAVWTGQPFKSAVLAELLTAGGQAKPRWPWNFGLDDPAVWSGQPFKSAVLAELLTVGGQIKPRWPWNFGLDDPAVWSGSPLRSAVLSQLLTVGGQVKPRWPWNFAEDHATNWQFIPNINQILVNTPVGRPFVNPPWKFGGDDPAIWSGQPAHSALLANLLTAGGQVKPRWSWNFGLDDPAVWSGQPAHSALLANLLTAGGKVKPRWSWNFAEDHAAQWQFVPNVNLANALAKPFVNPPWKFGGDDPAVWTGQPIHSALLAELLTAGGQVKPRISWTFSEDHLASWQFVPNRNQPLAQPVSTPFVNPPWKLGSDDPPIWSWQSLRNLLLLTAQAVAKPFINMAWLFGYDDRSVWDARSRSSLTLILPPFVPVLPDGHQANFFFKFDNDAKAYNDPIVGPYLLLPGKLLWTFVYDIRTGTKQSGFWCVVVQSNPLDLNLLLHPKLQFALDRQAQFAPGTCVIVNNVGAETLRNFQIIAQEGSVYATRDLH